MIRNEKSYAFASKQGLRIGIRACDTGAGSVHTVTCSIPECISIVNKTNYDVNFITTELSNLTCDAEMLSLRY